MKTILFVNDLIYGGGVEKVMEDIILSMPKEEYRIIVYTDKFNADFYDKYPSHISYVYGYKDYFKFNNRHLKCIKGKLVSIYIKLRGKYIANRLNKLNPDIAIAIKEGECMKFVGERIKAKKKLAWVHVDYNYLHWTGFLFGTVEAECECMKGFDKVVCVSQAAKDSVISTIGDPGNLIVRYNPLNEQEIINKSKEAKPERDMNLPLFVSVGRIADQKAYEKLLEVCKSLNAYGYKYKLWIVGGANESYQQYYEKLKAYQDKYQLSNVSFLGDKSNPYPYIAAADCYVSSAVWESYGLTIQEALILNTPVIAASCPAIEELFDYDGGWICKNTVEGIYKVMKHVLDNPDELVQIRSKLEQKSRDTFKKRIEDIVELF